MTDNKDLKYTQQFKPEPNIPKTYEQFILEEQQTQPSEQDQKIADSYAAEFVAYKEIGINTPVGGVSINLEEAAENCTIQ